MIYGLSVATPWISCLGRSPGQWRHESKLLSVSLLEAPSTRVYNVCQTLSVIMISLQTQCNVVQTVVCLARGLPSAQGECIHSIRARHHEFLVWRQKRCTCLPPMIFLACVCTLQTVYVRVDGAFIAKAPSTRAYTVCRHKLSEEYRRFCLQTKNSWCRARIEWIHSPWAEGRPLARHTTVWTTLSRVHTRKRNIVT